MNEDKYLVLGFIAVLLVALFLCLVIVPNFTIAAYKDGQVNAINDNIEYELIKTENGEMIWSKKE